MTAFASDEVLRQSNRLPRWLAWYLNFGLKGLKKRARRGQRMCNAIMGLYTVSSIAHVIWFYWVDRTLWPSGVTAFFIGTTFSIAPFMFRALPRFTVIAGSALLLVLFSLQTLLLGSATGMHIYMLIAPMVWMPIVGAAGIRQLSIVTVATIISVVLCSEFAAAPLLDAASDPIFVLSMRVIVFSWTASSLLIVGYYAFFRAETAEDALEAEHARSEALLYNLLPTEIAARLKVEPDKTIADSLPQVAILFADIVNFTPRSSKMAPEDLVNFLNRVFSAFDELAEKHGLEKIKTIGDAYMVAAGMPHLCGDPVHRVAAMALDMLETTKALSEELDEPVEVRIGIHAGPAVAGVIGNRKLFYDVWGETVNTASRMESHGEAGRIQVTEAAKAELEGDYSFEPRGQVEVKGMGKVETWWLTTGPQAVG